MEFDNVDFALALPHHKLDHVNYFRKNQISHVNYFRNTTKTSLRSALMTRRCRGLALLVQQKHMPPIKDRLLDGYKCRLAVKISWKLHNLNLPITN